MRDRRLQQALALTTTALLATVAGADDIDWIAESGGFYHFPINWSPNAVPGADDRAIFDLGGTQHVTVFTEPVNSWLLVRRGTVTLDLQEHTYDAGTVEIGGPVNFGSLIVEGGGTLIADRAWITAPQPGFLSVTDGSRFEATWATVGSFVASGTLNVGGGSTAVVTSYVLAVGDSVVGVNGDSVLSAPSIFIGNDEVSGGAKLEVITGGTVTAQNVWVGLLAGSSDEITVSGPGSALSFTDTFNIARAGGATVTVSDGATLTGGIVYVGAFDGDAGLLILDDVEVDLQALRTDFTGTLTLHNNALVITDSVINRGVIEGHGAFRGPVANVGVVKPGGDGAVDTLRMTGETYEQLADGVLEIEIDGPGPFDSDRLNVRGEATLGGTLDVRAIGGYEPTRGRRFNVLLITTENGSISGKFDTVLPPDTWSVIYEDDAVLVTPIAGACPDLDGSGDIGFGDLLAVLGSWGPCSGCPEDVDGNEIVDFEDLLLILSLWGPCD